ncbi:1-deoxy-D-xylulose-5-phosphate synthase [candidate division KSB1 bacterium]|nr:1-deoxy-D-xylulose-5-phosphate synthase [candidate division KSB1 bacterium]RQW01423.1 MAG: 1-deoxy-D-xylulose-5-phosphate synthase [candidate division KSB1 bacterium]
MDSLLSQVNSPADFRAFDVPKLARLAKELREYIIATVANTGGHLAPSLGVIELTIVLHYLFDTPRDKIVWDVGHQTYAHKIITGRRDRFPTIRQYKGLSGFPSMSESEYDSFGVGHASTSISSALGIACARDLNSEDYKVISVIGDGALTGGLAYEGLNNAGASGRDIVVILNDNSMSISPNVGAMSKYLTSIIANPLYNRIKEDVWDMTGKMDGMGPLIRRVVRRVEEGVKAFITPGVLFERLGFRYLGPVDGHNIASLIHLFREVKKFKGPVLVHLLTKKGKGYEPAEKNASIFHGLGKFDRMTGTPLKKEGAPSYTQVFGRSIIELAERDKSVVAITAAMQLGTGLARFAERFPDRFFDVGIAEGHAVSFAAGLASQGLKPVCAIYSTFLQRAYDMIIHDVALQKLPVIFAVDRAGLVGDDGATHHGAFDIAFLRAIPNMTIMAPKDEEELRHMLYTALQHRDGPIAIRYPRGLGQGVALSDQFEKFPIGVSKVVQDGRDIAIISLGPLLQQALEAAAVLREKYGLHISVINARFAKPVDLEMLTRVGQSHALVLTIEEGTVRGGFGSHVAEFFKEKNFQQVELHCLGIPDAFVEHGAPDILHELCGLSRNGILQKVYRSRYFQSLPVQMTDIYKHSKAS